MTDTETPRPTYEIEIDAPSLVDGHKLPVTLRKPGYVEMMLLAGTMPAYMEDIESPDELPSVTELDQAQTQASITFMEELITRVTDIPVDVVEEFTLDQMSVLVDACVAVLEDEDPRRLDAIDGRPRDAPDFKSTHTEILKN